MFKSDWKKINTTFVTVMNSFDSGGEERECTQMGRVLWKV
jgi:hypothetical protein